MQAARKPRKRSSSRPHPLATWGRLKSPPMFISKRTGPLAHNGDAADIEATMRADKCFVVGDMEGEAVWLRIGKAIEELGAREKPRGATTH